MSGLPTVQARTLGLAVYYKPLLKIPLQKDEPQIWGYTGPFKIICQPLNFNRHTQIEQPHNHADAPGGEQLEVFLGVHSVTAPPALPTFQASPEF